MIEHKSRSIYNFSFLASNAALPILPLLLIALILPNSSRATYATTPVPNTIYLPLIITKGTASTPTPTITPSPTATNTPSGDPGTAVGRILWNDQPIAGVTVKLCTDWSVIRGCKTQAYTVVTGNDGRYSITGIPAGEYDFATKLSDQQDETGWLGIKVTVVSGQTVTVRDVNVVKYDLKLMSPIDNATVISTPTLSWEPYPNAAYYKVYVSNAVSFEKVTASQYTIANPLAGGNYYWDIYAYNAAGRQIAESAGGYHFVVTP